MTIVSSDLGHGEDDGMIRFGVIRTAVQAIHLTDGDAPAWKESRLRARFRCITIARGKPPKSATTSAPVQYADLAIPASTTAMTIMRR